MVAHFWCHKSNFYKVFCVQMFMVNNLALNALNNDSFWINNLIMKTFAQLFFENNAFIIKMNFWNKKYGLVNWLDS
jgi:hypothetical protein